MDIKFKKKEKTAVSGALVFHKHSLFHLLFFQKADKMRLTCDIDVVNRTLATHNLKKVGKSCRAQLSIGKKPGSGSMKDGALYLMLCTAKDRNGAKYVVTQNICLLYAPTQNKCFLRYTLYCK